MCRTKKIIQEEIIDVEDGDHKIAYKRGRRTYPKNAGDDATMPPLPRDAGDDGGELSSETPVPSLMRSPTTSPSRRRCQAVASSLVCGCTGGNG